MPGDDRVGADSDARQAVTKMASIIDGQLQQAITDLQQQGVTLSDPNHWSGPTAARFRNDWDHNSRTLTQMKNDLDGIRQSVDNVTKDIMTAGGAH
jgi:uncharacterized protein YukE